MVWQPNAAAVGFNVYRAATITGHSRINSAPMTGASFAKVGLRPNATYSCQISAIDGASHESARTTAIPGTTTSQPVACDPYFSENFEHVRAFRAAKFLDI